MKRALVALIAGTVLSGFAAAYASTGTVVAKNDGSPAQPEKPKASSNKLAATD